MEPSFPIPVVHYFLFVDIKLSGLCYLWVLSLYWILMVHSLEFSADFCEPQGR
jgi:hypothetical protein